MSNPSFPERFTPKRSGLFLKLPDIKYLLSMLIECTTDDDGQFDADEQERILIWKMRTIVRNIESAIARRGDIR